MRLRCRAWSRALAPPASRPRPPPFRAASSATLLSTGSRHPLPPGATANSALTAAAASAARCWWQRCHHRPRLPRRYRRCRAAGSHRPQSPFAQAAMKPMRIAREHLHWQR